MRLKVPLHIIASEHYNHNYSLREYPHEGGRKRDEGGRMKDEG
jgi:hypothetical protein